MLQTEDRLHRELRERIECLEAKVQQLYNFLMNKIVYTKKVGNENSNLGQSVVNYSESETIITPDFQINLERNE